MSRKLILFVTILSVLTLLVLAQAGASTSGDAAAIKAMLEECYVHGAFNELNPEMMKRGFHPDFAIYSPEGETISKYPITTWANGVAKRKAAADFDPAKNKWNHKFASVDITGNSAAVKLELSKDGQLVYTDYLSLLKFDSGWRVVAKVYHHHGD